MLRFIFKRFFTAIPTLFILVTISFFLMRLAPGSPLSGDRDLPSEVFEQLKAQYHLDLPIYKQYLIYLKNLLRGDFGLSFQYRDFTVSELIQQSLPVSLTLGSYAFVLAVFFGVGFGIVAAIYQKSYIDNSIMALSLVGALLPSFVISPLLVLLFAITLKWLPVGGWNDGHWKSMVMPVIALALSHVAAIARLTRAGFIETMSQPFIRTAQSKGLPYHIIVFRHALRPALLPVVSFLGPTIVGIVTGSVIIETVFGLPGLGQFFVNGALNRDYSLVLALTLLVGMLTILSSAVVDVIYTAIDPKIKIRQV